MDWTAIIGYVFSAVTAIAGWLVGRRRNANNFLQELQKSVNMLAEENAKLLEEVVGLRKENADLLSGQEGMKKQIEALRSENEALRKEIAELNGRLAGVKTITRKA